MNNGKKIFKSISGIIADNMTSASDEIDKHAREERRKVQEEDLRDIDFSIKYNRSILKLYLSEVLLILVLSAKSILRPVFDHMISGKAVEFDRTDIEIFIFIGLLIVSALIYAVRVRQKGEIHVTKNTLYWRDRNWHYLEISKVTVNCLKVATIYSNDERLFCISSGYENFDSFLTWAKKCDIPVTGWKPVETGVVKRDGKNIDVIIPTRSAILIIVAFLAACGLLLWSVRF